jgi:type VI secretion system protein ImpA
VSLDVDSLMQELSPEAPCGEDISYDPAYIELETAAKGTAETQFSEGEEPNWREVQESCLELLTRSKDLRVILYLALAQTARDGIPGFRDGIALLRRSIETFWDSIHPQLDPDDNNDPLERINIIVSLSPPASSYQDPMRFRERIMAAPLCSSKQMGSFGLQDILLASGEMPTPEGEDGSAPDIAVVNGAFEDTDIEQLQGTRQAIADSLEHVTALDKFLTETVGVGSAPNLDSLTGTLKQALSHTDEALDRRGYGSGATAEEGEAGGAEGGAPAAQAAPPGTINSDQDVLRALDRIMQYYERKEPSSPVPLVLKRAKRLVGKSFVDIIRDLSPDAMSQVRMVSGGTEDNAED